MLTPEVKESLEQSKAILAARGAEIIAHRTNRVASRKFLWLSLIGIPRLARIRALTRKANELLGNACCECHR